MNDNAIALYGSLSGSRSWWVAWMCREAGIEYENERTEGYLDPSWKSPDYLAINPNGLVPAIKVGEFVLWESMAVNLYLAKKHGGPLAPANPAEDAAMTMWALWAVIEVEPHALTVLVQRVSRPPAEHDPKLTDAAIETLRAPFSVLDRALASGHLVGGRFTVADINTAEIMRFAMAAPELFDAAPNVKAWLAACQARPAFKAMMAEREKEPA